MANKFAEDIRRIAKGTRFKGPLGLYQPRDPILESQIALITDPMALGGGYGNGGLNNETPASEAPNSETEQNENEGDQNPAPDPNNPNTFYKGGAGTGTDSAATEGSFDAAGIIDGTAGPQTTNGTSGGVNEITGFTDCESGTPFNLQMDGNFPVPEGWEDAETPPADPTYIPGGYWIANVVGSSPSGVVDSFHGTQAQSDAAMNEKVATALAYWDAAYTEAGVTVQDTSTNDSKTIAGINYNFTTLRKQIVGLGFGFPVLDRFSSELLGCGEDAIRSPFCDVGYAPPTAESWPEDGTFELANQNGNLVTSDFDADAPAPYSSSGKDFCFGEDRTGKILVTADGGTMIYETNAEGAPTGTVRIYGPDGTAQGFGDATEGFISQWLPK